MSVKDCGHHEDSRRKFYRHLFAAIAVFVVVILLIILLIWLILRPTKPRFILIDATIYAFNLSLGSAPNLLTTNLQVTLSSRNPNSRVGIYYDRLDVYAVYRSQQITLPTQLPPAYQGHKDVAVWSPFVYGSSVPVAPYLSVALNQDAAVGNVLINIRIDGRVRWKVGTFISGRYRLYVNCPAYISFGSKNGGVGAGVGPAMKYQLVQTCTVDV